VYLATVHISGHHLSFNSPRCTQHFWLSLAAGVPWLIDQAGSQLLRYLPAAQGGSNRWDLPGGGCTDLAVSASGLVAAVCRNRVRMARVTGRVFSSSTQLRGCVLRWMHPGKHRMQN